MVQHSKKWMGIAVVILLSFFSIAVGRFHSVPPVVMQEKNSVIDAGTIWTATRNMTSAENAAHHFQKHGREFGFKTAAEYVAAAIAFTTEPLPAGVLKNIQKDDDTAYYNPKTAEYAVRNRQGRIRTYFKLDPRIHGYKSNTAYFNAHAKVGADGVANDNHR